MHDSKVKLRSGDDDGHDAALDEAPVTVANGQGLDGRDLWQHEEVLGGYGKRRGKTCKEKNGEDGHRTLRGCSRPVAITMQCSMRERSVSKFQRKEGMEGDVRMRWKMSRERRCK